MKYLSHRSTSLLAVGIILFPSLAFAHAGTGDYHGILLGLSHPFSGLDHLLAMLAIGLWAAQQGGRARWLVPLGFVSVMALSGLFSMSVAPLPFVEGGITLSLLALGLLIMLTIRLPLMLGILIAATFAVFHGAAHGSEMPQTASSLAYALGFVISTAVLHLAGIAIVMLLDRQRQLQWLRYGGAAILMCGFLL